MKVTIAREREIAAFFYRANFARRKYADHSIASYMLPTTQQVQHSIDRLKAFDLLLFGAR